MVKSRSKIIAVALALVLCFSSTFIFASAADTNTPPEKPSGEMGQAPDGTPPDGEMPGGTPPSGQAPSGTPGQGGADTMKYDYSGTLSGAFIADGDEKNVDKQTISTSTVDQNAVLCKNGGTLTVSNSTLSKSGSDNNGDNCNFYGINSILLAVGSESKVYASDSKLIADGTGSNGIFATDNATVYANGNIINTSNDNSRGLDATYGGTIVANALEISTKGEHCAAIVTDRGGGNISVTNSTLSTAGSGSPLLYSTGNIQVDNVTGVAKGSQLVGMEGLNTVLIYNSSLESTITKATASDPIADGIIIYQSTSGDAEATTGDAASFQAVDSTLKSSITSGSMFYFTNTTANVVLKNTILDFDTTKADLMTIVGNNSNNWGKAGSNGATVTFTGIGQSLNGDINIDTISSLDLYLLNRSVYTGTIYLVENADATTKSSNPITINVDDESAWVVTGNSTVTNLNVESGGAVEDEDGNTVTIVANGKTVVKGKSNYTVTVTGKYSNTFKTSASNELSTDFIDRTDFDKHYSTKTSFTTNMSVDETDTIAKDTLAVPESKNNIGLYIGIGAAVAAIIAVTVIVVKRKKNTLN